MTRELVVTAHQAEPLDALVWRALGTTTGIEAVLEANPGVADVAVALPEGRQIRIPRQSKAARSDKRLIQLWD